MKQARLILMCLFLMISFIKSEDLIINSIGKFYKLIDTKTQLVLISGTLLVIVKYLSKNKLKNKKISYKKTSLKRNNASLNLQELTSQPRHRGFSQ